MEKPTSSPATPAPFVGVKNTWLRRMSTLALLKVTGRLGPYGGGIWLSPFFVVKHGATCPRGEVEAMQYVAQHTSLPVPKIYCAFERGDKVFIVMQRLPGKPLGYAWRTLGDVQKTAILTQLRQCFDELRALQPPRPGVVGSAEYNALWDFREGGKFGPFDNIEQLHDNFGFANALYHDEEAKNERLAETEALRKAARTTRFTHGDMNSTNFLIKDAKLTAVLDWGFSGWYPEYWEYTASWHTIHGDTPWWREELANFLNHYPHELKMDQARRRRFPVF